MTKLINQINISSVQEAEEILKAAGSEDLFEKAKHQDGDMHPNGKWVWVSSANGGKGDWRTKGGRTHAKHSAGGNAGTGSTTTTQQKSTTQTTGTSSNTPQKKDANTTSSISAKTTDNSAEKVESKTSTTVTTPQVGTTQSDESGAFELKKWWKTFEYTGNVMSKEIVEHTFKNDGKYSVGDKIEKIKDIDENKEYNPEQIEDLFKYPDDISDKKWDKIVADFKDSIDDIKGNVREERSRNLISGVVPFSLKYAEKKGNVSFSDFNVSKIGEIKEKIKSNSISDLMSRDKYDFYEASYVVKTKRKNIKIKTYLAVNKTLDIGVVSSFLNW